MKKFSFIAIALLMIICYSCKPSRTKSTQEIKTLESELYSPSATSFNKEPADKLLMMYDNFIKEFPNDTLTPVFLFKSANLAMNAANPQGAISRFDLLIRNYPSNPKAPVCLFFKGYIYENMLKDLGKAKEAYLLFIEKYPDHELIKDAKMSIQNLGKTPEQMIKEFEMNKKQDSVRKADSIANLKKKKPVKQNAGT